MLLLIGNLFHFFVWFDYAGLSVDNPITKGTDADQYIQGTESLLKNGELSYFRAIEYPFHSNFVDDDTDDRGFYYAFRTPGFNFIHFPLRLFLSYNNAIFTFLIIQVILSALAKLLITHFLAGISHSKKLTFWLLVTFFILDINLSFLNILPLTESMGASFLVFSFYMLIQRESKKLNLFFSGLFFILSVFFRPFLIAVLLLYLPFLFVKLRKEKALNKLFYFLIPIILITGSWTIRNYIMTDRLIFLATSMEWVNYTNKAYIANQDICFKVGMSHEFWSKESPLYWLTNKNDLRSPVDIYPKEFCNNHYTEKSLKLAKNLFLKSEDKTISHEKRKEYELRSENIFKRIYKNNTEMNALFYQIKKRINVTKAQFNPQPMKPFINLKYPLNWFSIVFELFIIKLTFYLGTSVAIFYFFRNILLWNGIFILSAVSLGIYFLFVIILLDYEQRELIITNFLFFGFALTFICNLISQKKIFYFSLISCIILVLSFYESFDFIDF